MPDRPSTRTLEADVLDSEIRWLASFGWTDHAIARQLKISGSTVESHLIGRDAGPRTR
jgi:FixJ family two-component response regulator